MKYLKEGPTTVSLLRSSLEVAHQIESSKCSRLSEAVDAYLNGEDVTIVCLPSLSFDPSHIDSILGISHYETRSLWEILHTTKEHVRVIFISSLKIPEPMIEYVLSHLPNPQQARERLDLLCVKELSTPSSLAKKALEDRELQENIRRKILGRKAFMRPFVVSKNEEAFSRRVGVPIWGMDTALSYYQTKSGNHSIFKQADVPVADNITDLKSMKDLKGAIKSLWMRWPHAEKFMFKFDHGVSGNGISLMKMPCDFNEFQKLNIGEKNNVLDELISNLEFKGNKMEQKDFLHHLAQGAILECFIEGENKRSPSGQAMIYPDGKVEIISTHEQILGPCGVTYLGSHFPAKRSYRQEIMAHTKSIAEALSFNGVVGPCSVDYLVCPDKSGEEKLYVIEINIRQGGTTHPFQMASFLEDDKLKAYISNDNFMPKALEGLETQEAIEILKSSGLLYDKKTKKGFIFHMLTCLSEFGKCGYTLVASSQKEAKAFESKLGEFLTAVEESRLKEKCIEWVS